MTELIVRDTEKIERREEGYQDILIQGTSAAPSMQQIDALVRLIVQIVQRAKEEDIQNA